MVERFLLPELAFSAGRLVNSERCVVHPRVALSLHGFGCREDRQQMHMVGHDNDVAHSIPLAVKVQQRVCDNLSEFRLFQEALALTGIEDILAATIELLLEVGSLFVGECRNHFGPVFQSVVTALLEPLLLLAIPAFDDLARNRVRSLECDENDLAGLRPVRSAVLVDHSLGCRIKGFTEHDGCPAEWL